VPGYGVLDPLVMCIGEAPGRDEDLQGEPFVGKAGQYLDKWFAAIGLDRRKHCYIANILKCRPPQNRDPEPAESEACLPYLERQIELIRPKTILTLGRISTQILLNTTEGLGKLRKKVYTFKNIPLLPTYHPSAVLRNPDLRRAVWEDLKRLKELF
jgi:DNA polymerase